MIISAILSGKGNTVFTTSKNTSITECIRLMNDKHVGALIVTNESGAIDGIITERDILRMLDENADKMSGLKVSDIMTGKERLITTTSSASVEKVMEIMTSNRIRHIPVIESGRLIGVISIGDIVKNRLEHTLVENQSMKSYIAGTY